MLEILTIPDPFLNKIAEEVPADPETRKDLKELIDQMTFWALLKNRSGGKLLCVGLAAPQVGYSLRLFVMLPDPKRPRFIVCINPKIVSRGQVVYDHTELCFSAPGISFPAKRYAIIDVTFEDVNGKEIKRTFSNWEAQIFQHEMDHLNGICCGKKNE